MYTVVLIAQKGGTGKTTLALSLAIAAMQDGLETLIIDLDPQGTSCNWSDRREAESPLVLDAQPGRLSKALKKAPLPPLTGVISNLKTDGILALDIFYFSLCIINFLFIS